MIKPIKKFMLLSVTLTVLCAGLGGCAQTGAKNNTENQQLGESNQENNQEDNQENNQEKETENAGDAAESEGGIGNPQAGQAEGALKALVFEGHDLEGNAVSSDILSSSKLTMINVWATYCNPCLSEMPGLGELAEAFDPEEFQIIGIISDVQEGADQHMLDLAADLVERTGAGYTHLLLNESLYFALLTDVTAVPTTFFIDQEGNILDTVVGSMKKEAWEDRVHALLETQ